MLNFLGFSAQLIVIAAIAAIVISCISSLQPSSVVISATCIPCAEAIGSNDDATQSVSHCALSMTPPVYVTAIDEPGSFADDLDTLTIRQLKALCKSRSVKSYSYLRKHELIELLSAL